MSVRRRSSPGPSVLDRSRIKNAASSMDGLQNILASKFDKDRFITKMVLTNLNKYQRRWKHLLCVYVCVSICLLSLPKAEVMCVLCKHRVTLLCVYVKCGPHAHTHVCARTKSTSGTGHVRTASKRLPAHTSTDDAGKHTHSSRMEA